jgi:PAS domain S-box-containing protein
MNGKDEEIKSFKHHKKAGKVINNVYGELDGILGSEKGLKLSNRYNCDLIEGSVDPLYIIDPEGKIKDINKAVELVTGYSRDQLIGTDFSDYFTDPDKAKAGYEEVSREGFVKDYPLEILHKNRDTTPVLYNASIYKDEKGRTIGVFAAGMDISQLKTDEEELKEHMDSLEITVKNRTDELIHANDLLKIEIKERKKMEKDLRESEKRYSITLDGVNDGLWDWDVSSGDVFFSNNYYKMLGYDPGEFPANYESWRLLVHPDDIDPPGKQLQEILELRRGFEIDLRMKHKSGKWLCVSTRGKEIEKDSTGNPKRIVGTLRDRTDRANAEKKIKESLEEKEILLKEIHHRVKNNLMIISSLLNLQSSYIKDKTSQDAFKESQNRAKSMALIHEKLYQSTDLKRIDFGDYISSLATKLFHTYNADPSLIKLKINAENILLDINTAIPLGLIVNELITNSLKHAFPDGKPGKINVNFHTQDDHYEFTVKDNGIGFPEDLDYQNTDSLGLQLINSLTSQIDGEIELDRNNGTEFKIKFPEVKF